MKRIIFLCLLFAVLIGGALVLNANAIDMSGDEWFEMGPKGAVSVKAGSTLSLTVLIRNITSSSRIVTSLQAVVIDPFNGTRILGPLNFSVGSSIAAGKYISKNIALAIPTAVGSIQTANKTLAAVIYSLDSNQVVRGSTGWAFVVSP